MYMKGVSPLVATVMLIAITLVVAGILGGLVTQFAREQTSTIQYCTGARILLLSGVYQPTPDGLNTVIFSIHNYGDVDVSLQILQTYVNGTVRKVPVTQVVKAGDVGQAVIPGIDLIESREFTLQSKECAGAQDLIRVADMKQA